MYNIGYRHISIDISIYRHRICLVLIFLQQLAIQSFFEGNPQLRQPVKAFRLQAALLGIVHLISYPVPVDGGDSYGGPMMLTLHSPADFPDFIVISLQSLGDSQHAHLSVQPRSQCHSRFHVVGRNRQMAVTEFDGWEKVGRESPIRESGRHTWDTQKLMATGNIIKLRRWCIYAYLYVYV